MGGADNCLVGGISCCNGFVVDVVVVVVVGVVELVFVAAKLAVVGVVVELRGDVNNVGDDDSIFIFLVLGCNGYDSLRCSPLLS